MAIFVLENSDLLKGVMKAFSHEILKLGNAPVPGRKVLATIRDCASSTEHDLLRMVSVELKTPAKFMLKYLDIIQFLNIFTVDLFITFASINYLMSKVNIPVHHEMLDVILPVVLLKYALGFPDCSHHRYYHQSLPAYHRNEENV
ncbi:hypothetical protein D910_08757 [Dendroctonus ponderosae]|uniref:Uncharacterized protein n=1 Tax=Dendroctonus ponderosae TaxID=77166 RepID=U4UMP5_DENPD|nr:hypothetical protein D910_08757 [Dendroctonus ponderosae]